MQSKFKFIIVSKNNDSCIKEADFDCILNADYEIVLNNTVSLPALYNKKIDQNADYDFIVMMHGDVQLDIKDLMQHVEKVKDKYDLIGLCGCSKISVSQSPLNWFCGSRPFPNCRWGCVTHGELGNQTTYFSQHSPQILDHEVSCIDGLCIVFTRKAVVSDLRFDENLAPFDMYDTDISFQALIEKKLRIGVVVQKDLKHYSVGRSITTDQFLLDEIKFRDKWHLEYPPNSKIAMLKQQLMHNGHIMYNGQIVPNNLSA